MGSELFNEVSPLPILEGPGYEDEPIFEADSLVGVDEVDDDDELSGIEELLVLDVNEDDELSGVEELLVLDVDEDDELSGVEELLVLDGFNPKFCVNTKTGAK